MAWRARESALWLDALGTRRQRISQVWAASCCKSVSRIWCTLSWRTRPVPQQKRRSGRQSPH
eukprot:2657820-Prorocentrum_lima.AAC.1